MNKRVWVFGILLAIAIIFALTTMRQIGYAVNIPSSVNVINPNYTPPSPPTPQPQGSSGGGAVVVRDFSLDKDLIKVLVKQGETSRQTVSIRNTGNTELSFNLSMEKIDNLAVASENSFTINPGETKIINIDFFARVNERADAYTGRIIIRAAGIEKIINVIVEVKERSPLFDISTKVVNSLLSPGNGVKAEIKMTNMGDLQNIDVLLYYAIKDFDGNMIASKEESLAVNKTLQINREIMIPDDIPYGKYVFYSRISYGNNMTAASSSTFEVVSRSSIISRTLMIVGGTLIVVGIIWFIGFKRRKKTKRKK